MQVKKFNNLWLMGIILSAVILVGLYLAKTFFPSNVIQIAEIPCIVEFGQYVDTHLWAYYLFNGMLSFLGGWLYCCACCRKPYLNWLESLVVLIEVALLFVIQKFLPEYYLSLNLICMAVLPAIICAINKTTNVNRIYSTAIVFTVHQVAQLISLAIRDMAAMVRFPNSATLFILLIDAFIWLVLLYNYFNYKEKRHNGNT